MSWLRLWWFHALAVAAVAGCIAGGLWQLGVWEHRRAVEPQPKGAVAELTTVWKVGEPFPAAALGRKVTIRGQFGPERLTTGQWHIAPLQISGTNTALLVVADSFESSGTVAVFLEPRDEHINIPRLANQLPYRLYNGYGIGLTQKGNPVVAAQTPGAAWTVGIRNLVYAVQWWIFAAFSVFMWWRICRDQVGSDG